MMRKKHRICKNSVSLFFAIVITITITLWGCSKRHTSEPAANSVPETHLFLSFPDSIPDSLAMPDTSTSIKILYWYGDDVDGEVVGYYYSWDDTISDTAWTYTTENMDTFFVPIRESFRIFTFFIKSVDNDGAVDPTPAYMAFPVINSPPEISFPVDFARDYMDVEFISFTSMTFGWNATDPDGDETIIKYEYFLGDENTSTDSADFNLFEWMELPPAPQRLTLSDLSPGNYRIFFRATDIASAPSNVIFYPDTSGTWTVREPVGEVLYIDDNVYFFDTESVYTEILDDVYGEENYTSWNIEERTYYYPSDMVTAFLNFNIIVWNGGSGHHFKESQTGLLSFLNEGGKLMIATTYASNDTTIYGFLPFDSVTVTNVVRPYNFYSLDSHYQDINTLMPLSYTFGFVPSYPEILSPDSIASLYRINYQGNDHVVAARYPAESTARIIMFSFYVHECNMGWGFDQLLRFILTEEFTQ